MLAGGKYMRVTRMPRRTNEYVLIVTRMNALTRSLTHSLTHTHAHKHTHTPYDFSVKHLNSGS